ncbi:UPF0158 family protein [Pajaroellobacter abortibovis]|uniref:Uncharacterized protein n=1 Tax=Pajaroellobacter abortibovis TaxID=1882918 RepID=A0A1L6MVJ0_9BACT|nr:UPF0158 family protein [Pajaroellobacter abortibovis]APR99425.1 hypothetical protein BCY86_01055 [Pajaroellobacter abortibovis]
MHVCVTSDGNYLGLDPVSSREQYRWMQRFIPLVVDEELHAKLQQAIDGRGAFLRFKDVLMMPTEEHEPWFAFRSDRLRTFMGEWLEANAIRVTVRPYWKAAPGGPESERDSCVGSQPLRAPTSSAGLDSPRMVFERWVRSVRFFAVNFMS